jgi:succinate-semialdehyde dehydrogenase/glutarate-semialdehyde dehydrogenase
MKDEVFGPAVFVLPVKDDEEALRIANTSNYALTGSVWSRDRARARKIGARIRAGAVMINDHLMSHGLAETPWGGPGDSGLGRTHGELGFSEMVRTQVIVDDTLPAVKRDIFWHPYTPENYRNMRAVTDFLAGPGLGKRIRSLPGVLKMVLRYWMQEKT